MITANDIAKAVEQLAPCELARFRAWFEAFDTQQFDAAIERDIHSGNLDAHADEALAAHRTGRKDSEYEPTQEELAGIDRGLRDARAGRFVSDQQIEAVFDKFRGK